MVKKQHVLVGSIRQAEVAEKWHRIFIALLIGISLMALATFTGGCSHSQKYCSRLTYIDDTTPHVSPKLLLRSPKEKSVDPQIFAFRSDWPAVTGESQLGQVTFSREYWYNRQSLAPNVPDYSYNLFQAYRYSTSVR